MSIDTSKLDKEAKRQYWSKIINNFNQSGIKLKKYCSQNGLNYDHMAYYLQRYRKKNQKEQDINTSEFIPIQLDPIINNHYAIKIDGSIEIKLPASSNINQVAALVAEIRKFAC